MLKEQANKHTLKHFSLGFSDADFAVKANVLIVTPSRPSSLPEDHRYARCSGLDRVLFALLDYVGLSDQRNRTTLCHVLGSGAAKSGRASIGQRTVMRPDGSRVTAGARTKTRPRGRSATDSQCQGASMTADLASDEVIAAMTRHEIQVLRQAEYPGAGSEADEISRTAPGFLDTREC